MSRTLFSKTDETLNKKKILVADASVATTRSKAIENEFLSGSFSKVHDASHLVWYTKQLDGIRRRKGAAKQTYRYVWCSAAEFQEARHSRPFAPLHPEGAVNRHQRTIRERPTTPDDRVRPYRRRLRTTRRQPREATRYGGEFIGAGRASAWGIITMWSSRL